MSVKNAVHKTSGYAAAAALSALLVKYPLRKLGMHKANAALMQAHEAASGAYFLAALLHMATSPKTSGCKAASGAAAFAVSVVVIADCHMAKDQTSKMQRHRIYSAALAAAAALHAF